MPDYRKQLEELTAEGRKLCHDLNQPLTVILARCQLLQMMDIADEKLTRMIGQIEEQSNSIANLVDTLSKHMKSYPRD